MRLSKGLKDYKLILISLLAYGLFESVIINITTPFGYMSWIFIIYLIKACINSENNNIRLNSHFA